MKHSSNLKVYSYVTYIYIYKSALEFRFVMVNKKFFKMNNKIIVRVRHNDFISITIKNC